MQEMLTQAITDALANSTKALLKGVFTALSGASYNIVLVGGMICILLYVAGWSKGLRVTGIMLVCHVILRVLAG